MLQKFTGLEFFLLLNMYSSSVGTVVYIKKSALQQYIMMYLESIDYDSLGWEIHLKQYTVLYMQAYSVKELQK